MVRDDLTTLTNMDLQYQNLWRVQLYDYPTTGNPQPLVNENFLVKGVTIPPSYGIEFETAPCGDKYIKAINREADFSIEFYLDQAFSITRYLKTWHSRLFDVTTGYVSGIDIGRKIEVFLEKPVNETGVDFKTSQKITFNEASIKTPWSQLDLNYESGEALTITVEFTCDYVTMEDYSD